MVVAPATADLLARAAHGLADDLLTTTLLAARCPVLLAPAMHTEMWDHPATRANVATLRERGVHVLEPGSGRLTGADTGPGRLPEPEDIARRRRRRCWRERAPSPRRTWPGAHVVVSAGGTREPLDPVRFLGNRSSGRQGVALAAAAVARGAPGDARRGATLDVPDAGRGRGRAGRVRAASCGDAVRAAAADADVVVMAAAVADFRPADARRAKIKKRTATARRPSSSSSRTPTSSPSSSARAAPAGQVVVGFAAETGDDDGRRAASTAGQGAAQGRRPARGERRVRGEGSAPTTNEVTILSAAGDVTPVPAGTKGAVAGAVWDAVAKLLPL